MVIFLSELFYRSCVCCHNHCQSIHITALLCLENNYFLSPQYLVLPVCHCPQGLLNLGGEAFDSYIPFKTECSISLPAQYPVADFCVNCHVLQEVSFTWAEEGIDLRV